MNTTERNNQIKTLKQLIAKAVESHKSTKKLARMSSNDANYNGYKTSYAQSDALSESANLFVAYTAYYMLRHGIEGEENVKSYIDSVIEKLRPENKTKYWPCGRTVIPLTKYHDGYGNSLHEAVAHFISNLNDYIILNGDGKEE